MIGFPSVRPARWEKTRFHGEEAMRSVILAFGFLVVGTCIGLFLGSRSMEIFNHDELARCCLLAVKTIHFLSGDRLSPTSPCGKSARC
jgi:hypothetical protein